MTAERSVFNQRTIESSFNAFRTIGLDEYTIINGPRNLRTVVSGASRSRFGCYSQVRTLVYSYTSARQEPAGKAQLDRVQLHLMRQVLERRDFLMPISISSLPR